LLWPAQGIEKDSLLFLSLRTTAGWECLHPLVIVSRWNNKKSWTDSYSVGSSNNNIILRYIVTVDIWTIFYRLKLTFFEEMDRDWGRVKCYKNKNWWLLWKYSYVYPLTMNKLFIFFSGIWQFFLTTARKAMKTNLVGEKSQIATDECLIKIFIVVKISSTCCYLWMESKFFVHVEIFFGCNFSYSCDYFFSPYFRGDNFNFSFLYFISYHSEHIFLIIF
jgi:hypothetical protein